MKNILVPTDFSACASYAAEAAFLFAQQFDANIHFLNCLNIPSDWSSYSLERQDSYPEAKQLVKNANQLMQKYKDRAHWNGIGVDSTIAGGELYTTLEKQVATTQADLVIMGTHGVSGKQEYFIGSNTQKAIRKLHVPIFIIKKPLKDLNFKQVIYASSFNTEDQASFKHFLSFVKAFQPETIHLLSVNTIGWFSQPTPLMNEAMESFKKLAPEFECKSHFFQALSVDAGVRQFAKEIKADLIGISNHQRHPIKRIFQGSSVEALANHADIPVLSIDFPKPKSIPREDTLFTEEYSD